MGAPTRGLEIFATKLFRCKVNIALVIVTRFSHLQPRWGFALVECLPRLLIDPVVIVKRETSAYSNESPVVSKGMQLDNHRARLVFSFITEKVRKGTYTIDELATLASCKSSRTAQIRVDTRPPR